ncbi:hypothetical protein QF042_002089 [Pedobacter sp. W3I1]|nr:hypothetical protein [Pedobacter sp. W3I1]
MEVDIPILHRDKTNSRAIGTEEPQPLLFKKKMCLRSKKAGAKKAPR